MNHEFEINEIEEMRRKLKLIRRAKKFATAHLARDMKLDVGTVHAFLNNTRSMSYRSLCILDSYINENQELCD
jgi:hypothetical protein